MNRAIKHRASYNIGTWMCSTEWWKTKRTEEELLAILEDCFPQLPRLWLQSCAAVCSNPQNMRSSPVPPVE